MSDEKELFTKKLAHELIQSVEVKFTCEKTGEVLFVDKHEKDPSNPKEMIHTVSYPSFDQQIADFWKEFQASQAATTKPKRK